ncbi:DNA cytosine methyltransferase [Marilutibacter spongiae]|uniref:DNA (cytosine-5-)-methyltransferase n=1 Tax=Marilutibacter spongiae TaxID=2025720 RepID=A0A7W3TP19_9GAMM|nr:DNA cytosine methyltransferase [Lysobacter spongiae]MBB1061867.1 DNA cytosine methyltransferase [Lysobacter spongiae]
MKKHRIYAVDLFCGVGGLSLGLNNAGVSVVAGYDFDESCRAAYEANIKAPFHARDIRDVCGKELAALFPEHGLKLMAGCAPCQPFSTHMRGLDTSQDAKWSLLDEFSRLIEEVRPDFVTMENVAGLRRTAVFKRFVERLLSNGFSVQERLCYGPRFGLAQRRRRLVLIASAIGELDPLPDSSAGTLTVRQVIGELPAIGAGEQHPTDPLHKARSLSPLNMKRIKASRPGGTWHDWPLDLRSACHRKSTGSTFRSVYARMAWDEPAPTITTQSYNFGTGRFGHPVQDRAITLREAALLQGFPCDYKFFGSDGSIDFMTVGKHIGNAVPPPLGAAVGRHLVKHLKS